MFKSYFEAAEKLIKLANDAAKGLSGNVTVHLGKIANGDQFIASAEKKDYMMKNFSSYVVEMEGGATAHAAMFLLSSFGLYLMMQAAVPKYSKKISLN
ncbi:hypothetical protein [Metabacillus fastidiosus]|uniref:phosphorylase family protein n=1 Tax=Metabacillus fastidiosus TaxID=1458 RepID=UPI003D2D14C1